MFKVEVSPALLLIINMSFVHLAFTFLTLLYVSFSNPVVRIPLTYAFDWDLKTKLPIQISFNHSNIYSTSTTKELYLLNHNISANVKNFPDKQNRSRVEIGLKFPSDFIVALSKTFGTAYQAVELGTAQYLQALLFDDNMVESKDVWMDGISYNVHVKYNFGDDMIITNKPMRLIEGETVYFEEYLIRQALHRMSKENQINFIFNEDSKTIDLMGKLENLPKLTIVRGNYIFKIKLSNNKLNYIPALDNKERVTLIGYKALEYFNKMRFLNTGEIVFKCTSLIYQIYLFFLYFVGLFLFLVFVNRKNLYDTSLFVRHILRWVFFKDMSSRVQVLKSQLQ